MQPSRSLNLELEFSPKGGRAEVGLVAGWVTDEDSGRTFELVDDDDADLPMACLEDVLDELAARGWTARWPAADDANVRRVMTDVRRDRGR